MNVHIESIFHSQWFKRFNQLLRSEHLYINNRDFCKPNFFIHKRANRGFAFHTKNFLKAYTKSRMVNFVCIYSLLTFEKAWFYKKNKIYKKHEYCRTK